jgi:hypothetical protein
MVIDKRTELLTLNFIARIRKNLTIRTISKSLGKKYENIFLIQLDQIKYNDLTVNSILNFSHELLCSIERLLHSVHYNNKDYREKQ